MTVMTVIKMLEGRYFSDNKIIRKL